MDYLRGLLGLVVLISIASLFSRNRRAIDWKLVGIGIVLQIIFGLLITQVGFVASAFQMVSRGFVTFLDFSVEGAAFLFGDLARSESSGHIFAFQVLPQSSFSPQFPRACTT